MNPKQAVGPFLKLLISEPRGMLKALLRHTKEAYRASQFKGNSIKNADVLDVVDQIDEEVNSYTYLDGTSRTMDIAFLKAICRQYAKCNYLEIGSWRGESILNVASVVDHCTSVSLSKEEMMKIGLSSSDVEALNYLSKDLPNVTHIEANSQTYDFDQLNSKFDVIFIDGDHSYKGVRADTVTALKLLKDDNSVIIWHDCGFGMQDLRYESIAAIHDACSKEQFDHIYRVSNTMCAIYTKKELKTSKAGFETQPNKLFDVKIKGRKVN
ncbi:class I SAM-dependent methyltransferase [Ekhidna sp. To15]|uniref:class I SAM-dependent methyltransferase n=1 Tax=Ekhidna sp. To15 TaxID=3395267 RepID=UPI003F526EA2